MLLECDAMTLQADMQNAYKILRFENYIFSVGCNETRDHMNR